MGTETPTRSALHHRLGQAEAFQGRSCCLFSRLGSRSSSHLSGQEAGQGPDLYGSIGARCRQSQIWQELKAPDASALVALQDCLADTLVPDPASYGRSVFTLPIVVAMRDPHP